MTPSIELLEMAVGRLGDLCQEFVFVGGCVTGLLITDPAAPEVRPTTDVDVIVEVAIRGGYEVIADALRSAGFREDPSAATICRWTDGAILLDVMPTDSRALGFSNPWYLAALQEACNVDLPSGRTIRAITSPYFLATKLVAFHDRGRSDYYASHDLEDTITVVNGREEVVDEVSAASSDVRTYVAGQFKGLLADSEFINALPGHLAEDSASPDRVSIVLGRLESIARRLGP